MARLFHFLANEHTGGGLAVQIVIDVAFDVAVVIDVAFENLSFA